MGSISENATAAVDQLTMDVENLASSEDFIQPEKKRSRKKDLKRPKKEATESPSKLARQFIDDEASGN